jgi:hypothetical protein
VQALAASIDGDSHIVLVATDKTRSIIRTTNGTRGPSNGPAGLHSTPP